MKFDIGGFAEISLLSPAEAAALEDILSDDFLLDMARRIAVREFFPGGEERFTADESPALSQAWFAAAFLSFDSSRECYKKLGFPEPVWRESMTDLVLWVRNEYRHRQVIGLGPMGRPWQRQLYSGRVTRHGRLECNSEFFHRDAPLYDRSGKLVLQTHDPVINLHIPEDGPMDLTLCSRSVKQMAEFFAVCRPEYNWKGFLCRSWLLDRQLRTMLKSDSNIVKFQQLGICYTMHETRDTIFRLFGYDAPEKVGNPTSLQKKALEFIRSGGKFIEEGMFIERSQLEAVNFDLTKLLPANRG